MSKQKCDNPYDDRKCEPFQDDFYECVTHGGKFNPRWGLKGH